MSSVVLLGVLVSTGVRAAPTEVVRERDFRVHVNIAGQADLAFLQTRLEDARLALQGIQGPVDAACCTRIEEATFATFGDPNDGLDVVDSQQDLDDIDALGAGIYVVADLTFCAGAAPGALGCAATPGSSAVIAVDAEDNDSFGIVVAHELGHNLGMGHTAGEACNLMAPANSGGCLDAAQCTTYVSAGSVGDVCPCLGDAVGDPTAAEGAACSDAIVSGICSGGICADAASGGAVRWFASGGAENPETGAPDDLMRGYRVPSGWVAAGALGADVHGLAYAAARNRVFGVRESGGGNDELISINPNSGAVGLVGALDRADMQALAFDPASDLLIGSQRVGGSDTMLVEIDPDDASVTEIGQPAVVIDTTGLAWDPASGTLYAATGAGLFTYDATACTPFCPVVDVTSDPNLDVRFVDASLGFDPTTGKIVSSQTHSSAIFSSLEVFDPDTLVLDQVRISSFTPGGIAVAAQDSDGDDVPNDGDLSGAFDDAVCATGEDGCDDNCPFRANAGQSDLSGVVSAQYTPGNGDPDGVGDLCQCGDMNDDGRVNATDLVLYRRKFAGQPSPFSTDRCSVVGVGGICDTSDLTVMRRTFAGLTVGILQDVCAAFLGVPDPGP